MSVNLAIILGNVGKDPEVKVFNGGAKKASFTIATSKKYKDKDGNVVEKTEWHNIICWRNSADIVEKYVRKGTQLYVEGEITTRSYDDQSGQKKYITEIEASRVQLVGRKEEGQAQQTYQAPAQVQQAPAVPDPSQSLEPQSDDLPFNQ